MHGMDFRNAIVLMERNYPNMDKEYIFQGIDKDQPFQADYDHEGNDDCEECDPSMIMESLFRKM